MPIMAAQPIIQSQLNLILSKGQSANQNDFASQFTAVLTSVAPMGLMVMGLAPVPLAPAGSSACENLRYGSRSRNSFYDDSYWNFFTCSNCSTSRINEPKRANKNCFKHEASCQHASFFCNSLFGNTTIFHDGRGDLNVICS